MKTAEVLKAIPAPVWYAGAALVGGFVLLHLLRKGLGQAGAKVGHAVNPLNRENVFSTGANALGSAISGDESFSLGSAVYDWTHPSN